MRNLYSGLISGFFENGAATAAAGPVETSARRPDKRPPEMRNLCSGLISGFFENGAMFHTS